MTQARIPFRNRTSAIVPACLWLLTALPSACSSSSDPAPAGGAAGASAGAASLPAGAAGMAGTAEAGAPSAGAASAGAPSAGAASAGAPGAGAPGAGAASGGVSNSGGTSGGSSGGQTSGAAGAAGALIGSSPVTIMSRFPAAGATVCADAPLRLTFSAPVVLGSAGQIRVYKTGAPNMPVATVDIAATNYRETLAGRGFYKVTPVFLEGNSAVIYLSPKAIATPGSYYVTMDAGVFVDATKQALAAITGPASWQFTTQAPAPADPTKLTVSREGTADFCTVQGAVEFVPTANLTPTTITVKNGTYHEIVYIAGKSALTLHGEDRKKTVIAYPNNDTLQQKLGTGFRAMVEAENSNDLVFENLTLFNTTPQGGSQAEALRVEPGDRVILRNADFISRQDTLLLTGRVYVTNSYVEGNVDFIWGKGSAYFEKSEIKAVARPGYIVQSRNGTNSGYVFVDSTLSTDGMATGTMLARIEADRFPTSQVAYLNCKMGPHIAPKGWLLTNSTGGTVASLDLSKLRFWEFQSTDLAGAPLDVSMRDPASKQLSAEEAALARDKTTVLAGWNPTP